MSCRDLPAPVVTLAVALVVVLSTAFHAAARPAARSQSAPPPAQPAPRPSTPAPPPAPSGTAREPAPSLALLGVPVYPGAQFLRSFDAGRGQRFYLFGTAASFAQVVAYYKGALKTGGDLVFEVPATHMFEVGRFNESTMAFPPGVTIKDYASGVSGGYPNTVAGATPARFPTVIQIVPVAPGTRR